MNSFPEIRTATWAFLEVYGWATVFTVILAYIIYKEYIYDFLRANQREKKLKEQKKHDLETREKDAEKMREARLKQQKEHDEKAEVEKAKREAKEREEAERRRKEEDEKEKTHSQLGRSTPPTSPSPPILHKNPRHQAIDLIDNLSGSASIVIFGDSNCPDFRKACQLIATYRLDNSKFQIFEFDKQGKWPIEEMEKVLKMRFGAEKAPFIFVCGEFIGGLQEARHYDKEHGLDKAYLKFL